MLNPENRQLIKGSCSFCKKDIFKREIHFKLHKKNYCSIECQKEDKKTGEYRACCSCGVKVWKTLSSLKTSKSGNTFCGRSCATVFNNTKYKTGEKHPNYTNGLGSYREKALREYGARCCQCGYDKHKEVLEVHHKDKERTNNMLSNLEVLCPNCHKEMHLKGSL